MGFLHQVVPWTVPILAAVIILYFWLRTPREEVHYEKNTECGDIVLMWNKETGEPVMWLDLDKKDVI